MPCETSIGVSNDVHGDVINTVSYTLLINLGYI